MAEQLQDVEFSDDEVLLTWEEASTFELPFGKYKGVSLADMIKSKQRRGYLRYLQEWDKLRPDTRASIEVSLNHYDQLKNVNGHQDPSPVKD